MTAQVARRIHTTAIAMAILALLIAATSARGQRTRAGQPASRDLSRRIPYGEDPNVPGLTREEKIKRQEALLRQQYNQARSQRNDQARELLQKRLEAQRENMSPQVAIDLRQKFRKSAQDKLAPLREHISNINGIGENSLAHDYLSAHGQ